VPFAFLLGGCVRVLELTEPAPTDTAQIPTDPTLAPLEVCVPGDALGFRLPSPRWGLSALYASRRLDDRPDSELRLPPSFFLASGWQISGFGCAEYGPPWVRSDTGDEGCLVIPEGTAYSELCKLFPRDYDCDGYAGTFAGDAPEADALGLAWFAVAAHALLGRFEDPEAWYREAGDPLAAERLTAEMHFAGPWSGDLPAILETCADDVEACLDYEVLNHVAGVADKLATLQDATCYDEPLAPSEVSAFVAGLAEARAGYDWAAAEEDALAALTGAGFSTEAPAVLAALDAAAPLTLACPELELYEWYRLPCP
jgi:hypothetical protein